MVGLIGELCYCVYVRVRVGASFERPAPASVCVLACLTTPSPLHRGSANDGHFPEQDTNIITVVERPARQPAQGMRAPSHQESETANWIFL